MRLYLKEEQGKFLWKDDEGSIVAYADTYLEAWAVLRTAYPFFCNLVDNFTAVVKDPPPPAPPVLLSPGSSPDPGPVLTGASQLFSWTAAVGATGAGLYITDLTAGGT